jgi:hypothetical protein
MAGATSQEHSDTGARNKGKEVLHRVSCKASMAGVKPVLHGDDGEAELLLPIVPKVLSSEAGANARSRGMQVNLRSE